LFRSDNSVGGETEAVAIKAHRPLQIDDGERDQCDAGFHRVQRVASKSRFNGGAKCRPLNRLSGRVFEDSAFYWRS
jgi:hypothetical protein